MPETNVTKNKRYVAIAEFQRLSGLSYPTIKNALESGELRGIRTEAEHWKVDTLDAGNTDTAAIVQRLDEQARMLKTLCAHLGVQ